MNLQRFPRHPLAMARFGVLAMGSARGLAQSVFQGERARALFAGLAAHSIQPLERAPTAAFGLMLGLLGHAVGWPMAKGGSQKIADALAGCPLVAHGVSGALSDGFALPLRDADHDVEHQTTRG